MDQSERDDEFTGQDASDYVVGNISLLIQATLNEKNSPEILDFQQDLISTVEEKLSKQV
eukprot:gene3201-13221_t